MSLLLIPSWTHKERLRSSRPLTFYHLQPWLYLLLTPELTGIYKLTPWSVSSRWASMSHHHLHRTYEYIHKHRWSRKNDNQSIPFLTFTLAEERSKAKRLNCIRFVNIQKANNVTHREAIPMTEKTEDHPRPHPSHSRPEMPSLRPADRPTNRTIWCIFLLNVFSLFLFPKLSPSAPPVQVWSRYHNPVFPPVFQAHRT